MSSFTICKSEVALDEGLSIVRHDLEPSVYLKRMLLPPSGQSSEMLSASSKAQNKPPTRDYLVSWSAGLRLRT